MLKLLTVTWVLKPLIAYYILEQSIKKRFIMHTSYIVLCVIFLIASQLPMVNYTDFIGIMFLVNLTTSLQDVTMDSVLIELVTSAQMSNANVAQNIFGKVGSMFSGITFSLLSDVVGLSPLFYILILLHFWGFIVAINIMGTPLVTPQLSSIAPNDERDLDDEELEPPRVSLKLTRSSHFHNTQCGLSNIWHVDGTPWGIIFLLSYKIGELGTASNLPIYLIDIGYSPSQVGLLTTIIGELFGMVGSMTSEVFYHQPLLKVLQILLATRTVIAALMWLLVVTWDKNSSFYVINSLILLMMIYLIGGGVSSCSLCIVRGLVHRSPRRCRSFHCSFLNTIEFIGRIVFSSLIALLTEQTGYIFIFGLFICVNLLAYTWARKAPDWLQNRV
ncbi:major facilitator superfamily domain-containing protein 3 isoform X1 [Biomphalaria pfeifferi]|uniref:Major facilitator superfamily domain-containing protein 3 isoform X1 n=1 Tax=Biomphalaria pfeifferi TaxID=112525 RepID=A0AAD8BP53_BIOPF|nr:major facilitator superfamily domain-containing protein 3 isoform X1 [Biomphalaria pfeifferi]